MKTKLIQKIKEEFEEKVVDILRAVHVHGVDGDFDGCDGLDKDPQSLSVQTATKKITKKVLNNMKSKLTEIKKDYFERTIHDPSFDTEEGRWEWIETTISQTKQELIEEISKKYEKAKIEKPFVHKLLNQTAYGARERHGGFLSGLLVAKDILEKLSKK